jgi:hypothetical protein
MRAPVSIFLIFIGEKRKMGFLFGDPGFGVRQSGAATANGQTGDGV